MGTYTNNYKNVAGLVGIAPTWAVWRILGGEVSAVLPLHGLWTLIGDTMIQLFPVEVSMGRSG